jgi:acyl CoA:acetate/3-ketoacid CoA transferase beta subunit
VHRIYTDLAVLEVTPSGLRLIDVADGLSIEELARCTAPIASGSSASHHGTAIENRTTHAVIP